MVMNTYEIIMTALAVLMVMALTILILSVVAEIRNPTPLSVNSAPRFKDVANEVIHCIYEDKVG